MSDLEKLLKLIDESGLPVEPRWFSWDTVIDAIGILLIFGSFVMVAVFLIF